MSCAPLAPNALVTLSALKAELGIAASVTDGALDNRLVRYINVASQALENFCNRQFAKSTQTERYAIPANRDPRLVLVKTPILDVVEVLTDDLPGPGALLTSDNYDVEDADAGFLYMVSRWPTTSLRRGDIVQDYEPGSEEQTLAVTYTGGYVTPAQVDAAPAWATGVVREVGDLLRPAAYLDEVWKCTTRGASGLVEPAWGTSPVVGSTIVDGAAVWTFAGSAQAGAGRTLPYDLEQAALDVAAVSYRRAGVDLDIVAESLGDASYTYAGGQMGRRQLPQSVRDALAAYVRVL